MRPIIDKLKPKKGFANILHILISAFLPLLLYVLVRMHFVQLAVIVLLLSKWRMLAVKPRFWPANIRANAVDLMVGLATIVFMTHSFEASFQLAWAALYGVWLVAIKPGRSVLSISLQAIVGQTYALMALFVGWPAAPLATLVLAGWSICYLTARHYLSSFDEPYTPLFAQTWGYFAAGLMWLSGHWLIFYSVVAQPTLLLTVLGFGLGGLYYLNENDRLSTFMRRQIIFIMIAVVIVVLVFSHWGDRPI